MNYARTVSAAVATVTVLISTFAAPVTSASVVDVAATTSRSVRASRAAGNDVTLDPATRRIVVVGDSILFSRLAPGARANVIVPLAQMALGSRVAGMRVSNQSAPGLSTLYVIDPRATTVRRHVSALLDAPGPSPDVVVIAVSSIDLNLFPDTPVASLAPALITELRATEQMLSARGVETLFLPAFSINGALYNELRSRSAAFRDYGFGRRVDEFNAILRTSGLPLLFDHFAGLDRDRDGTADRLFYVGYDQTGAWPDDGIHPNALGERVFGDNLANGLVAALGRA